MANKQCTVQILEHIPFKRAGRMMPALSPLSIHVVHPPNHLRPTLSITDYPPAHPLAHPLHHVRDRLECPALPLIPNKWHWSRLAHPCTFGTMDVVEEYALQRIDRRECFQDIIGHRDWWHNGRSVGFRISRFHSSWSNMFKIGGECQRSAI